MDIEIDFSDEDIEDLEESKRSSDKPEMKRHRVRMPEVRASTPRTTKLVEDALEHSTRLPQGGDIRLDPELVESAKATWTASGGNTSEVAALYDLTPEAVIRLASQEGWPVYQGTTKLSESRSKAQLKSLQQKLWLRIEVALDSMEVETKEKDDITQHRLNSRYIEPLASRSSAFKILMDQYMRVSTLLEPEIFSEDPDPSNYHAAKARNSSGNVQEVNREIADFFSEVFVGIADRISDRDAKEREGYGEIIEVSK